MDKVSAIISKIGGIYYAYDHFAESEDETPPYICYKVVSTEPFSADGEAYLSIDTVHVELYTDKKDPKTERKVEKALKGAGIIFNKNETWIESEKLYEVIYEFDMEDIYDGYF